ncbi:MAG: hypothetical protein RRZ93_07660, partial [Ruthenibacterium sp.]
MLTPQISLVTIKRQQRFKTLLPFLQKWKQGTAGTGLFAVCGFIVRNHTILLMDKTAISMLDKRFGKSALLSHARGIPIRRIRLPRATNLFTAN